MQGGEERRKRRGKGGLPKNIGLIPTYPLQIPSYHPFLKVSHESHTKMNFGGSVGKGVVIILTKLYMDNIESYLSGSGYSELGDEQFEKVTFFLTDPPTAFATASVVMSTIALVTAGCLRRCLHSRLCSQLDHSCNSRCNHHHCHRHMLMTTTTFLPSFSHPFCCLQIVDCCLLF